MKLNSTNGGPRPGCNNEFALEDVPLPRRKALVTQLADWYAQDPSSGIHGAAGWLLRRWGQADVAAKIDQTPRPYSPDREWFTLAIKVPQPGSTKKTFYYTFIVFPAGEYTIGSPEDEPGRSTQSNRELRHPVTFTRPFAILDREITFEELIAFLPTLAKKMVQYKALPGNAGFSVHWYDAVGFCRWLGEQSGLAEADQAYASPNTLDKGVYPREESQVASWAPRDWPLELGHRGFRLPTEAEWEVAVRSAARTAYGFGSDPQHLGRFAWFTQNSGQHVHPPRQLRPSMRGAFDLHGNLLEWTHDWYVDFKHTVVTDPLHSKKGSYRVYRGGGWGDNTANCRAAQRMTYSPTQASIGRGFRLALSPSGITPEGRKQLAARKLMLKAHGLMKRKKWQDAVDVLKECLRLRRASVPKQQITFLTEAELGSCLAKLKQFKKAEVHLLHSHAAMMAAAGSSPRIIAYQYRLVTLYDAWGKFEEALKWQRIRMEASKKRLGKDHRIAIDVENHYGLRLYNLGRWAQAEKHLLASYEKILKAKGVSASWIHTYRFRLIALYETLEKYDDALKWHKLTWEGVRTRLCFKSAIP